MRSRVVGLKGAGRTKDAAIAADRMFAEFGNADDKLVAGQIGVVRKVRTTL